MSSSPDPLELVSVPDAYEIANRIIAGETCYLVTYLDREFNIIIHQQQLESINSIIHIYKNKKNDKFEIIKKTNINKCIQWCEKYKIPYNNFIKLTNIFYSKKKVDNKNSENNISNINPRSAIKKLKGIFCYIEN